MSQGEERGPNDASSRALKKLDDATMLQTDASDLKARLSNFHKSANDTFEPINELTAEIESEKDYMREVISHIEMCDEKSNEELRKAQTTYDEMVRQHTLALDAQNEELSGKVNELAAAKQDLAAVEGVLKQKEDSIAELQHEMNAEICLLVEQRQTLANLLSSSEIQAKKSKFAEEQNFIQAESARLDEQISSESAENEAILEQTSAMSKELATMEAQKRAKLVQLDELQSKLDASKVDYAREMKINEEIVAETQARQRNQDDELLQLEQKLSESRAAHENAKKANDDITNRINSEYGSVETLEEVLLRAEAELRELDMECSGLSDQCVAAKKKIVSNDIKITKLNESNKTFLEDIKLSQSRNEMRTTTVQHSQMSSNVSRRPAAKQDAGEPEAVKAELPLEHEHIFSRPLPVGANANPKKRPHSQEISEQQLEDNEVVNRSVGSSLSELWPADSDVPAENDDQNERHLHAVTLFKKFFM